VHAMIDRSILRKPADAGFAVHCSGRRHDRLRTLRQMFDQQSDR
jgi:hypothetical protein